MSAPRTIVSGGTGLIGRFIVERLLAEGHEIVVTGRNRPETGFFSAPVKFVEDNLDPDKDHTTTYSGAQNFVHAAFNHLPGRFRGGEGDDPAGFRRCNLDGTLARFRQAKHAGMKRAVFLSSRAVYGDQPPGIKLTEATTPHPNSLYGEVKLAAEAGLAALTDEIFSGVSLRVTGVYGPPPTGREHKWTDLINNHLAGLPAAARCGTEVHGEDVAWAVQIALTASLLRPHDIFCVSDIQVDNADILSIVNSAAGLSWPVPERADPAVQQEMAATKLRALGWHPGGRPLFEASVRELVQTLSQ